MAGSGPCSVRYEQGDSSRHTGSHWILAQATICQLAGRIVSAKAKAEWLTVYLLGTPTWLGLCLRRGRDLLIPGGMTVAIR